MTEVTSAKLAMRREMRIRCRDAATDEGSAQICEVLVSLLDDRELTTVMIFEPVTGEPDLGDFAGWCGTRGITTLAPVADRAAVHPVDPSTVDVVIVPGLAFTADGRRLGQGGGWYDRFLAGTRPDCQRIGACFATQLVDHLPTEDHDVRLDIVVTENGVAAA